MSSSDTKHCWPTVSRTLVDYTNSSTIHGVKYIGVRKRTFGERILWGAMFLIMLVACQVLIFDVYVKWTQNPVILSFANRPTSIWHIPFPAVTICPETKADSSKLNITEMYHRFVDNADLLYDLNETE
jgi:acid-sensing ion channel, other